MHKKFLVGTSIILAGMMTFIAGLIMVNRSPETVPSIMGCIGAILTALSPVSVLTVLMMVFDEKSDQEKESK